MSPDLREDIHEELGVALVACSLKGWRKSQEDTSAVGVKFYALGYVCRLHRDGVGWGGKEPQIP